MIRAMSKKSMKEFLKENDNDFDALRVHLEEKHGVVFDYSQLKYDDERWSSLRRIRECCWKLSRHIGRNNEYFTESFLSQWLWFIRIGLNEMSNIEYRVEVEKDDFSVEKAFYIVYRCLNEFFDNLFAKDIEYLKKEDYLHYLNEAKKRSYEFIKQDDMMTAFNECKDEPNEDVVEKNEKK
jgi:hypothetical protein